MIVLIYCSRKCKTIMNEIIWMAVRAWNWGRELLKGAHEVFWGDGKLYVLVKVVVIKCVSKPIKLYPLNC